MPCKDPEKAKEYRRQYKKRDYVKEKDDWYQRMNLEKSKVNKHKSYLKNKKRYHEIRMKRISAYTPEEREEIIKKPAREGYYRRRGLAYHEKENN